MTTQTPTPSPPSPPPPATPPSTPQVQIINKDGLKEANREADGFIIKDGIIVLCKNAHIPSGTVI
jgi:hypothetical protein